MNPYVFIVGCPRSGTTLLQRVANAHAQLAVTHETRWIARWYEKRAGIDAQGRIEPELVERIVGHDRFKAFKITPEQARHVYAETYPATYAEFVGALFDRFAASRGKKIAGDKSPDYALHIPTLHGLWPQARFVHIIRDGRDVALSMLEWQKGASSFATWADDPLTTIAVWWEWHIRLARMARSTLGPSRYLEMTYEDLVEDTASTCRRLCDFLELPFDDTMLHFYEGRTRSGPGLDAKRAWLPVMAALRDWRGEMSLDDLRRFEAAAGDLLDELGYRRQLPAPSPSELGHAADIRSRLAAEALARGRAVPPNWTRVRA